MISWYINLLVLAAVLAILVKLVIILKLGLRSISKRITSLIILNIYSPQQHTLTHISLFVLKQLIRLTLNSTEKLQKLYILTGKKLKYTTKSFSSHSFTIASVPLASSAFVCFSLLFSAFLFHHSFTIASVPLAPSAFVCFLHFSFICCFHYLYANYQDLLLS